MMLRLRRDYLCVTDVALEARRNASGKATEGIGTAAVSKEVAGVGVARLNAFMKSRTAQLLKFHSEEGVWRFSTPVNYHVAKVRCTQLCYSWFV